MATRNTTLAWTELDMANAPRTLADKHAAIRAARAAFEAEVVKHMKAKKLIPEGADVQFSHKWGKVSVAFVDKADAATTSGAKIKL